VVAFLSLGERCHAIKLSDLSGVGRPFSPSGRDAEGREGNTLYRIFACYFLNLIALGEMPKAERV